MAKINSINKILITGGAGYIGSVLSELLAAKEYQVTILDAFYWGKKHLKHLGGKVKLTKTDIRDVKKEHLKNVDAIIHLAALSNDPMADFNPQANFAINTEATKRLAYLAKEQGVKKFTFSSSASVYDRGYLGKNRVRSEDFPVKPKKAYSQSKYLAEQELLKLADKNFCPVIFRTGTVYGFSPRMRLDLVVNTMVKDAILKNEINIFCGGIQWRPLVDVEDVARAHLLAIEASEKKVNGQIINLVYDNIQILTLAKKIQQVVKLILKREIKINVDSAKRKDRSYRITHDKISRLLGWHPTKSIETSIKKMIGKIENSGMKDLNLPQYYNITWMKEKIRI